jgi:hypothetical protein
MVINKTIDGVSYSYQESFWTGKKSLIVNGSPAIKCGRSLFTLAAPESDAVQVKGSFLSGVSLYFGSGKVVVLEKNTWWEWILIIFPLLNIGAGVFGGLIGGCLSALFGGAGSIINASILRGDIRLWERIVLCILVIVVVSFSWLLIYFLAVNGLKNALNS